MYIYIICMYMYTYIYILIDIGLPDYCAKASGSWHMRGLRPAQAIQMIPNP